MAILRFSDRPFFNPWAEFERIRQGLDQLSRGYQGEGHGYGASVYPPLNVYEDPDRIIVKAELPGVALEDLELRIEAETLTIKGVRGPAMVDGEGVSYHRHEIEPGEFSRAITLPSQVDQGAIEARLVNGILTITLPRAAEVKPRRIDVKAG